MAGLLLGLIFFSFSFIMFLLFNYAPGEVQGSLLFANITIVGFMVIGIVLIAFAVKKIIADRMTDLKGEFCYGMVTGVKFNGTIINNVRQYDAYLKVYIESTGQLVECHENIGDKDEMFAENTFYAVKYYNNDINIEYKVPSFDALPDNIKEVFDTGEIIPEEMYP